MARRLAHEERWSPPQTFGFASLVSPDLIALTGTLLSGMTGATSTGGFWLIRHETLVIDEEPDEVGP